MAEEESQADDVSEERVTFPGASSETAASTHHVPITSLLSEDSRRGGQASFERLGQTFRDWLTIALLAATAGFTGWQAYLFRTSIVDAREASQDQQRNTVAALDIARRQSEALLASANATQRAAKATEDQATSSRARLSLTLDVDKTRTGKLETNNFQYADVDITITNRGQSEALITSFHTKLLLDAQSRAYGVEPNTFIDIDPTAIPAGVPIASYVWPPDDNVFEDGIMELWPLPDEFDPMHSDRRLPIHIIKATDSQELYKQYHFGSDIINRNPIDNSFLWVYIAYKDIFNVERQTSIYVNLRTGEISTHHPEYNCSDDTCPDTLSHLDANP